MQGSGKVIWICGLSGAGKSTLAQAAVGLIRARGLPVVLFDGDELREIFSAAEVTNDNHGRDGRLELAMRYAKLCRLVADQGLTVVIATISLFREVHAWNRAHLDNYFEIYLKVPIEELRRRDPKGIYRRFDAGEMTNVAGLDLPIDEPQAADWVLEFEPGQTVDSAALELMSKIYKESIR